MHRHDSWYLAQLSDNRFALGAGWCTSKQDMATSKSCLRWLVASCEKRVSLLTKRKSAACNHNRYAHRYGGVSVESVRRSYEHHDESCSDDSKIVQHISKDMNDDSIDSQIAMRMVFRRILLIKSARCRTWMGSNMTRKIRHLENWSACFWFLVGPVMVVAVVCFLSASNPASTN